MLTSLRELFHDSLRNLIRHKVRSCLTLLGVVFGIAAVITMMAVGEGAQRTVLEEIGSLGLRNIIIDSVKPSDVEASEDGASSGWRLLQFGLTENDASRIETLDAARVNRALRVDKKSYAAGKRIGLTVMGARPSYFDDLKTRLIRGRLITALDEITANPIVVITPAASAAIGGFGGALSQTLKIGNRYFDVVGVAEVPTLKGTAAAFMPYATAYAYFGTTTMKAEAGRYEFTRTEVGQLLIHADREDDIEALAAAVSRTLAIDHRTADFKMTVPLALLKSKQRTQRVFNLVLITIACISLLVGGIGIMNIMLTTVMERIREIGIRRAVGASRRDIFLQFLAETLTLSSLGGVFGVVLGLAMVPATSQWTKWPGIVTPSSVILSLLVASCVGLVFGTAPAIRASRLNPVDALRHE